MKELRRQHFRHTWEARERGELVLMGVFEWFLSLFAGFGDFANPSYGPYYTALMRTPEQLVTVLEATEARGLGRELCSSMRTHLGQLFTGMSIKSPKGGTYLPDVIVQPHLCHSVVKTGQIFSEHLGLPYCPLDFPWRDSPSTRKFLVGQFQETIEWMERTTGRKFDDERFLEALRNEWECTVLWARICELTKAVPAPLDFRQLWSLRLPLVTLRHKKEAVAFYRDLLAETRERVAAGISARGFEGARLLWEGGIPFYNPGIVRLPERYGAITVGGQGPFCTMGTWKVLEDGSWVPAQTPWERGMEVRNREEGLWALADLYLGHFPLMRWAGIDTKPREFVKMALDWRADGVVFAIDRGCKALSAGIEEARLAVQGAGIPTVLTELSMCDPRDLDLPRVADQVYAFLESLGLTPLEETQPL